LPRIYRSITCLTKTDRVSSASARNHRCYSRNSYQNHAHPSYETCILLPYPAL